MVEFNMDSADAFIFVRDLPIREISVAERVRQVDIQGVIVLPEDCDEMPTLSTEDQIVLRPKVALCGPQHDRGGSAENPTISICDHSNGATGRRNLGGFGFVFTAGRANQEDRSGK